MVSHEDNNAEEINPWLEEVPSPATTVNAADAVIESQAPIVGLDPEHVSIDQLRDALVLLNRKPAFRNNGKEKFVLNTKEIMLSEVFPGTDLTLRSSNSIDARDAAELLQSLIPEDKKFPSGSTIHLDRVAVADAINAIAQGAASVMKPDEVGELLMYKLTQIGKANGQER